MHKMLELTTASLMRYIDAAMDIGVCVSVAEPLSSYTARSGRQYKRHREDSPWDVLEYGKW